MGITTMSLPTKTNTHTADTISSITETLKKTTTSKPIVTRIISNVSKTKQAIVTTTMKKELNSMKKKSPVVSSDEKLKFLIANKSEQNTKGLQMWLLLIIIIIGSAITFCYPLHC